jgi:phosphatidylserine/phosphatidylglycerophosphate/cardiolipin synthase-like enzyme
MSKRKRSKPRTASSRRGRATSIWTLIAALLLLLVAYLAQEGFFEQYGIGSLAGQPATRTPAVQQASGDVQVFFTTPYLVYPDEPEARTPPPHEQAIIADIDNAQTSIDAAFFEYNLMSIADALIRAQQRGVDVRLALDRENLEDPDDALWAGEVERAGIPISWEDSTAFLHSKFIIIDDTLVWTGSWNATVNGTYRNNNNLLRLRIPALVENYHAEFAQMADGVFGNDKASAAPNPVIMLDDMRIENYFSPQDGVAQHVVARVREAQEQIRFLTFSYTSDEIAQAMLDRQQEGVLVQGVFENRSAGGIGAEFDRLASAGADVWRDGNCYTMHHKVIIVDDATVITGSYNFTQRAEDTNDENLLIIDSPELAAQYIAEFERVFAQAQNPTPCGR